MLLKASTDWGVAQHRVSGELYPLFLANHVAGCDPAYDAGDLSPYTRSFLAPDCTSACSNAATCHRGDRSAELAR